jgi:4,5-DOPA dioxygenase extradiol
MSAAPAPAAAFDHFLRAQAPASRDQRRWTPADGPMPALYLSHGAPPLFEDALWIGELFSWSQTLPKPTAILIISAHWESAPLSLSASGPKTPLVYDFGGFAQRYFQMTYETPGAGALAARVAASMPDSEPVHHHASRGLDHGAWVPLKAMYPYADVPVLQMSIPTHNPGRLMDIGGRLRSLREEGALLIGSGHMTHGVRYLTRESFVHGVVPSWSSDFDSWAAQALARGEVDTLANYRSLAPAVRFAHPTVEHYTPLFIILGAASDVEASVQMKVEGYRFGLSKRSFQVP